MEGGDLGVELDDFLALGEELVGDGGAEGGEGGLGEDGGDLQGGVAGGAVVGDGVF